MFNLGIKQIIINSDTVVTSTGAAAGDTVSIEGFGDFTIPAAASAGPPVVAGPDGFVTPAEDAVAGVYTITPPDVSQLAVGQVWDLTLVFSQGPRVLSEIWSYGERKLFQSRPLTAATQAEWVDKMIEGLEVNQEAFGGQEVLGFTNVGDELVVTFKPGYEGIGIKKAYTVEALTGSLIETDLTIVETTAPSEGVNLGKQIEAEVRNATFDNIDPYGVQFGGNSSVDVRGKYTEIHWSSVPGDVDAGWEPHEMRGYGDANTATVDAPVQFSAFVNEGSASGAVAALTLLTTGA